MQIPKFAWKLLGVGAGAFAVTFTIYFFNLDMKLLSAFEPILLRHYDRIRAISTCECKNSCEALASQLFAFCRALYRSSRTMSRVMSLRQRAPHIYIASVSSARSFST